MEEEYSRIEEVETRFVSDCYATAAAPGFDNNERKELDRGQRFYVVGLIKRKADTRLICTRCPTQHLLYHFGIVLLELAPPTIWKSTRTRRI